MFGPLGIWEILLILGIALLIFGPRKLPEVGRTLGRSLGEFRRATTDLKRTIEREVDLEDRAQKSSPPRLAGSTAAPSPAATGGPPGGLADETGKREEAGGGSEPSPAGSASAQGEATDSVASEPTAGGAGGVSERGAEGAEASAADAPASAGVRATSS